MKPNGVIHYDFNFFGLTLPLQKLAFVPRFSSVLPLQIISHFQKGKSDRPQMGRRLRRLKTLATQTQLTKGTDAAMSTPWRRKRDVGPSWVLLGCWRCKFAPFFGCQKARGSQQLEIGIKARYCQTLKKPIISPS